MNRRTVLLAPLALAACNNPAQIDTVLATVVADAQTIAGGLQGMLPQLGALNLPGLTPAVMAIVGSAVADLQGVATSLQSVSAVASAQPLVQKIESYVNVIVSTLAALPLPPPISTILVAASVLLPVLESTVGLIVNSLTPATAKAAGSTMTAPTARLILKASAARK